MFRFAMSTISVSMCITLTIAVSAYAALGSWTSLTRSCLIYSGMVAAASSAAIIGLALLTSLSITQTLLVATAIAVVFALTWERMGLESRTLPACSAAVVPTGWVGVLARVRDRISSPAARRLGSLGSGSGRKRSDSSLPGGDRQGGGLPGGGVSGRGGLVGGCPVDKGLGDGRLGDGRLDDGRLDDGRLDDGRPGDGGPDYGRLDGLPGGGPDDGLPGDSVGHSRLDDDQLNVIAHVTAAQALPDLDPNSAESLVVCARALAVGAEECGLLARAGRDGADLSEVDGALRVLMRLIIHPSVARDPRLRRNLVDYQRCLHAKRAVLSARELGSNCGIGLSAVEAQAQARLARLKSSLGREYSDD